MQIWEMLEQAMAVRWPRWLQRCFRWRKLRYSIITAVFSYKRITLIEHGCLLFLSTLCIYCCTNFLWVVLIIINNIEQVCFYARATWSKMHEQLTDPPFMYRLQNRRYCLRAKEWSKFGWQFENHHICCMTENCSNKYLQEAWSSF